MTGVLKSSSASGGKLQYCSKNKRVNFETILWFTLFGVVHALEGRALLMQSCCHHLDCRAVFPVLHSKPRLEHVLALCCVYMHSALLWKWGAEEVVLSEPWCSWARVGSCGWASAEAVPGSLAVFSSQICSSHTVTGVSSRLLKSTLYVTLCSFSPAQDLPAMLT